MKAMLAKIKVLPVLITLLLGAAAGNTWLQLWIQQDIVKKSEQLKTELAHSAEKSDKMNTQL
ncbi:MAG: hypothetical protein M0Z65_04625, partial [Firmicutes bacterium]|nr:hypothetical protein [Bacillota bacterium]